MIHNYTDDIDLFIDNYENDIFEVIEETKNFISEYDCPFVNIDISGLNLIDATKVCILCSTFHFAKYWNGKIKWIVKDELTKIQISKLKLINIEIEVAPRKTQYMDFDNSSLKLIKLN